MNLTTQLEQRAKEHPERIALIEHGREISYGDLYAEVCSGADFLRSNKLTKGDCILILEPISIDLYIHLLAVFHAGMSAMIVDPSAGKKVLTNCLGQCQPDGFVGSPKAHLLRLMNSRVRKISKHFHTVGFVPFSRRWRSRATLGLPGGQSLPAPEPVGSEHPALITFTSGSTGMPKAASRSHGFLLAQHEALSEALDFKENEVDLITLPIFAIANLASGMTSVIANTDLRFPAQANSEAIYEQCIQHNVTRCAASPAFFQRLHEDRLIPPFQTIYTGGAPVFPHLIDAMQKVHTDLNIVTVYGSTEAEPIAHIAWDEISPEDHQAMQSGDGLLVGKAVSATQVMICDTTPLCKTGEIAVTGDHVLKGYLNGNGDSESKFSHQGEIWHRTGDMGYLDSQNRLWLVGRKNAVITIADKTIYPFGIECAVLHLPSVIRCAVIEFNHQPLLCLELSDDTLEQVKADLQQYHFLKFTQLPSIPMDNRHNAKVDYPELRKMLEYL